MTEAQPDREDDDVSGGDGNVTKKSHVAILKTEIDEGAKQFKRTSRGLYLSGLSAGLDVGFSVLVLAVVMSTATHGELTPAVVELLKGSAYSVGFILVIFGRVELFTEQTTLAVLPQPQAPAEPPPLTWQTVGRIEGCANLRQPLPVEVPVVPGVPQLERRALP